MKLTRAVSSCNTECLFWFCVLWMIIMMTMIITQFFKLEVVLPLPFKMPASYLVLLILYAVRKETERWLRRIRRKRRGEIFFWLWWFLLLTMFIISSLSRGKYGVPDKALETCLYVSGVYFGTELSKLLYYLRAKETLRRPKKGVSNGLKSK